MGGPSLLGLALPTLFFWVVNGELEDGKKRIPSAIDQVWQVENETRYRAPMSQGRPGGNHPVSGMARPGSWSPDVGGHGGFCTVRCILETADSGVCIASRASALARSYLPLLTKS